MYGQTPRMHNALVDAYRNVLLRMREKNLVLPMAMLMSLCGGMAAPQARAASLQWDNDANVANGAGDGDGTWDTSSLRWFNGTSNQAWDNAAGSTATAVFGVDLSNGGTPSSGAAGTVTIAGGGVTANGIVFNHNSDNGGNFTGNYTLTGGTLTLAGATPTIRANTDATISCVIAGTAGLTVGGTGGSDGMLILTGANTYTGTTTVNSGLGLDFSNAGAPASDIIKASSPLVLNLTQLAVQGKNGATNSQTFAGTTVNAAAAISLMQNGAASLDVKLGALTLSNGALLYIAGATGTTVGARLTTTSSAGANDGLTRLNGSMYGDGADWASIQASGGVNYLVKWAGTYSDVSTAGGALPNTATAQVRIIEGGAGTNTLAAATTSVDSILMQAATTPSVISMPSRTLVVGNGAGAVGAIAIAKGAQALTIGQSADEGFLTAGSSGASTLSFTNMHNGVDGGGAGSPVLLTVNAAIRNNLGGGAVSVKMINDNLVFTGTNTYSGTTTANGMLQIGDGGTTGTLGTGNVVVGDTLAFNRSNAMTVSNQISGGGRITQLGSGTTTLSGANTFTKGVQIMAGTLRAGVATVGGANPTSGAFGVGGSMQIASGGTLDLNGFNQTVGSVQDGWNDNTGTSLGGGIVTNNSGTAATLMIGGDNGANGNWFSGVIQDGAGAVGLTKIGTGTQVLYSATDTDNAYTGATKVLAGTLRVDNAGHGLGINSAVTVAAGAALDISWKSQSIGSLADNADAGGTVTNSSGAGVTLTTGGNNASTAFAGLIENGSGGMALTKIGSGTQTLTGANTYTGATTVGGGTLKLDFSAAGAPSSSIINGSSALVLNGGTLVIQGKSGASRTQNFNGVTVNSNSTLQLAQNGATSLDVNLGALNFSAGSINFVGATGVTQGARFITSSSAGANDGGTQLANGSLWNGSSWASIQDSGGTHYVVQWSHPFTNVFTGTGGGTVVVPNTSDADVRIQEGGSAGSPNTLAAGTTTINSLLMNAGTTASVIRMNANTANDTLVIGSGAGASGSIAVLVGAQGLTIGQSADQGFLTAGSSGASTLNLNNASTSRALTVNAKITNNAGSGPVALNVTDSGGTVVLNGANTYSGGTTVTGNGILKVGSTSALGTGSVVVTNAILDATGINGLNTGNLTFNSGGTLAVDGNTRINAANVTVESGAMIRASTSGFTLGTQVPIITASGTVTGAATDTFDVTFSNAAPSGYRWVSASDSTHVYMGLQLAPIVPVPTHDIVYTNTTTQTIATVLADTADAVTTVTQNGTGTTILTAHNTYTGSTTVNAGVLVFGNGTTGGPGPGAVVNNATVVINHNDSFTADNALSGGGTWIKNGSGAMTLTDTADMGGTLVINKGVVAFVGGAGLSGITFGGGTFRYAGTDGGGTADLAISLPKIGIIDITDAGSDVVLTQAATGIGGLTKVGAGTLTLAGNNTYLGATTVTAGTLRIGDGGTSGSLGVGKVTNNATLVFDRSNDIAVANIIGGIGSLVQAGGGTVALTGTNAYTGTTVISSGTLQVGAGGLVGTLGKGAVTDNGVLAFNRSGTLLVVNAIGGDGGVQQNGPGTTILSGDNSYTGTTTVNAGILVFGNGTTGGPGSGAVVNNATVVINHNNPAVAENALSGNGTWINNGSGTITMTNTAAMGGTLVINKGVISLVGPASLSAITFGGGTFRYAGTDGGGTVNVAVSLPKIGIIDITDAGSDVVLTQGATGIGGLTKNGAGTLTLAANNAYLGATTVNAGTLQIGDGGTGGALGVGKVASKGALVFDRSDSYAVANIISGTGSLTKVGGGTLTLSAKNAYTGATVVSEGTLKAGTIQSFGVNSAVSVANGASLDVTGIVGIKTGTLTFDTGSTLVVNGTTRIIALGATVTSGAKINASTTGFVLGTQVPIITAKVVTAATTNTFDTTPSQAAPAGQRWVSASDATHVYMGLQLSALMAPRLQSMQAAQSPASTPVADQPADHPVLIQPKAQMAADAPVDAPVANQPLADATPPPALFKRLPSTQAPSAPVPSAPSTPSTAAPSFDSLQTLTMAQAMDRSTGDGVIHVNGDIQAMYVQLHDPGVQLNQTLDRLSGHTRSVVDSGAQLQSRMRTDEALGLARIAFAPMGIGAIADATQDADASRATCLSELAAESQEDGQHWKFFGYASYTSGSKPAGDNGSARSTSSSNGFTAGAFNQVAEDWNIGLTLGYDNGDTKTAGGLGSTDAKSYSVNLYAAHTLDADKRWIVSGSVGGAVTDYESNRSGVGPGSATAKFNGSSFNAGIETGYKLDVWEDAQLMPLAGLSYAHATVGAATETATAAPGLALAYEKTDTDHFESTVGAELAQRFKLKDGVFLTPSARLAWHHLLNNGDDRAVSTHFVGDPAHAFNTYLQNVNTDALSLELGATLQWNANWKAFANVREYKELGQGGSNQVGVGAGVAYSF